VLSYAIVFTRVIPFHISVKSVNYSKVKQFKRSKFKAATKAFT